MGGSGHTFHNMRSMFNPSSRTYTASKDFNKWLKETILSQDGVERKLTAWESAPGGRQSHPREEHLIPLFMVAAAADFKEPHVIYDTIDQKNNHAVTGYVFGSSFKN